MYTNKWTECKIRKWAGWFQINWNYICNLYIDSDLESEHASQIFISYIQQVNREHTFR